MVWKKLLNWYSFIIDDAENTNYLVFSLLWLLIDATGILYVLVIYKFSFIVPSFALISIPWPQSKRVKDSISILFAWERNTFAIIWRQHKFEHNWQHTIPSSHSCNNMSSYKKTKSNTEKKRTGEFCGENEKIVSIWTISLTNSVFYSY